MVLKGVPLTGTRKTATEQLPHYDWNVKRKPTWISSVLESAALILDILPCIVDELSICNMGSYVTRAE